MSDLQDPRVLFAAERTLLAWNRTAIGLMAFGFVVERAGVLPPNMAEAIGLADEVRLTLWIGLAFILLGSVTAIYSTFQFQAVLKTLRPVEFPAGYEARWGVLVNYLVASLGICLVLVLATASAMKS